MVQVKDRKHAFSAEVFLSLRSIVGSVSVGHYVFLRYMLGSIASGRR